MVAAGDFTIQIVGHADRHRAAKDSVGHSRDIQGGRCGRQVVVAGHIGELVGSHRNGDSASCPRSQNHGVGVARPFRQRPLVDPSSSGRYRNIVGGKRARPARGRRLAQRKGGCSCSTHLHAGRVERHRHCRRFGINQQVDLNGRGRGLAQHLGGNREGLPTAHCRSNHRELAVIQVESD